MSQKLQSKNKITIHNQDPVRQKNFEFLEYDHRQPITEEGAISSVLTFLTNRNTFENESCTPLRIDEVTVLEHRRVSKLQVLSLHAVLLVAFKKRSNKWRLEAITLTL